MKTRELIPLDQYSELLKLQEKINLTLKELYESNKASGREHLSNLLVNEVEKLIDVINSDGWDFGRVEYSGDVNFECSEQTYSNGSEMGNGVVLQFSGFSCQVSWNGWK